VKWRRENTRHWWVGIFTMQYQLRRKLTNFFHELFMSFIISNNMLSIQTISNAKNRVNKFNQINLIWRPVWLYLYEDLIGTIFYLMEVYFFVRRSSSNPYARTTSSCLSYSQPIVFPWIRGINPCKISLF